MYRYIRFVISIEAIVGLVSDNKYVESKHTSFMGWSNAIRSICTPDIIVYILYPYSIPTMSICAQCRLYILYMYMYIQFVISTETIIGVVSDVE